MCASMIVKAGGPLVLSTLLVGTAAADVPGGDRGQGRRQDIRDAIRDEVDVDDEIDEFRDERKGTREERRA